MIKRLYIFTFFCLWLFGAGAPNLFAQQVVTQSETDTMLIGDQQWITYQVTTQGKKSVEAPALESNVIEGIELLEGPLVDTLIDNAEVTLKYQYKITSFDSGDYQIPALPMLVIHQEQTDTLLTEPIAFRVNTLEIDTAKAIKPIKGPIEAPLTFAEALPFILIGLGIILLAVIIYLLIRRIGNKKPVLPRIERPSEPPHIEARKALDKLKNKDLSSKEQIKAYYTELSEITRYYVWRQLHVKTLEKTSEEIYQGLNEINFTNREAFQKLRSIFTVADYVKFAKYIPAAHEHEACLKEAYEFVDLTKPKEKEDDSKTKAPNNSLEKQETNTTTQKQKNNDA